MDNNSIDLEEIVDGRPLREWLKSDEGMVDYDRLEFGHNVSNTEDYLIYDLGMFYHDPAVNQTIYRNGVDLARVAAVNVMGAYRPIQYDTVDDYSALEGDDYTRIFFSSVRNAKIADFVYRFFQIIDGDVYISETCHHVFVKGRFGTQEEREAFAEDLSRRIR